MDKQSVRQQHTVPVCYLSNFGIGGNEGRDSKVYFYNVKTKSSSDRSIDSFPVINHFYDMYDIEEKHKQIIESLYTQIEGEFATLLRTVISLVIVDPTNRKADFVDISAEIKEQLSAQIAFQITRTQAFRNNYRHIYQQVVDGFPYVGFPKYAKEDFQRLHTHEILDFRASKFLANLFNDRNFMFMINHTDIPFITSDNPAVFINCITPKTDLRYPISPVSKESSLYFPITPKIAIQIFHKNVLKVDMMYFDTNTEKRIHWYNKHIVENCTMFLISNTSFTNSDILRCLS